jgi:putative DNA-invertase from lambdoid prophage Rac
MQPLTTANHLNLEKALTPYGFSSFAEFERSRIRERTQEGLAKAKAQGKRLGRPTASKTTKLVQEQKTVGLSQSKVATVLGISLPTVKRHWNK